MLDNGDVLGCVDKVLRRSNCFVIVAEEVLDLDVSASCKTKAGRRDIKTPGLGLLTPSEKESRVP